MQSRFKFQFLVALSLIAASTLHGNQAPTPYSIAMLVHERDEVVLARSLTAAIRSSAPLVRAAGARVIAVRGLAQLLPLLREALAEETDAAAAREGIRALALVGGNDDLAAAASASSKWPEGMDDALALAVARRGALPALQAYSSVLKGTRMRNSAEFFRMALWGHAAAHPVAGARIVGSSDERAWHGLLAALRDSNVAMHGPLLASSLGSPSEDIRTASIWFLARSYASDPSAMADVVKQKLAEPKTELSSDREDFGRELLRRMLGADKNEDPRWLRFLDGEEADQLLESDLAVLQYLTDAEYTLRHSRCEIQTRLCAMPSKRSSRTIPSQPVAPPAFDLPSVLPAGLADAILEGSRCREWWLGVGSVSVDQGGRVQTLDLEKVNAGPSCKRAIETLLRLSMATNTSMRSGFTGPVVLVHPAGSPLCLDEDPPDADTSMFRTGGAVQAPTVRKRVEPHFPKKARQAMAGQHNVIIKVETLISKTGCVRSLRLIEQSPFPELNGAALMALAQWTFAPGYLDGKPVDVLFNLSINFTVR